MKNKFWIGLVVISFMIASFGVVFAATDWDDDNIFNGTVNWFKNGVRIGQQDSGGVTFFNGTIVNETTTDDVDNPVTFGDNVRIDGELWRGEASGPGDSMPVKVNDDINVFGDLTVQEDTALVDLAVSGASTFTGDAAFTGDVAVTGDLTGATGTGLPIAYGICDSTGTTTAGSSNVTCSVIAGLYVITIDGETYTEDEYVTTATPIGNYLITATAAGGGDLIVAFETNAGVALQTTDFSFVVYKP